jgi:hypothetical protein
MKSVYKSSDFTVKPRVAQCNNRPNLCLEFDITRIKHAKFGIFTERKIYNLSFRDMKPDSVIGRYQCFG